MRKPLQAITSVAVAVALATGCSAPKPRRDVMGIQLTMTKAEADSRLKEIGKFLRTDRRRQEVWEVRDPSFSHVIIGLEKNGALRFVTAIARKDAAAEHFGYEKIGKPASATDLGKPSAKNFYYRWPLGAKDGQPATFALARGHDPSFLDIWSIVRSEAGGTPPREVEDDD